MANGAKPDQGTGFTNVSLIIHQQTSLKDMPDNKTTLEVGDKLYSHAYGVYSGPYIIDRVTATQAFIKGTKLKRQLEGRWIRQIGGSKWNSTSYHLETPEIKETVRVKNLKSKVVSFNFESLPVEKLERIYAIITEQATS